MQRIERMQEQLQLSLSRALESFGVSWKKMMMDVVKRC